MSMVHTEPTAVPLPEIRGYRLLHALNHGAMSTVYLADQIAPPRQVAIKVVAPHALTDEVSRRRFENEVRTIARLEHPHVVRINELGRTAEGLPYYSMPHLPRGHLGQRSFRRPDGSADEARVMEVMRMLLSALHYAHSRGVVHRDVKAENVLFDEAERPLLADFGVALRRGYGPRVTAAGLAVGSTAYMAPEQARGEDVDGRADLYSLGVLAWEMLTGELPYRAGDALSMAVMHAQDPIPRLPAELRHWQRFMNRALAKVPVDRFDDAPDMEAMMSRIERRRKWQRTAAGLHRASAQLGRVPRVAWGGALLLAVVGGGVLLANGRDHGGLLVAGAASSEPGSHDPAEAMFRPLQESPLQVALEDARRHIREGQLLAPAGANAFESVQQAWAAGPGNTQVAGTASELADRLVPPLLASIGRGERARSVEYAERIAQLHGLAGHGEAEAASLQQQVAGSLSARIDQAAANADPVTAGEVVELARALSLPTAMVDRLATRAGAIKQGDQGPRTDAGGTALASAGMSISLRPVSRAEYARFAAATGREPSRCRTRGSLLRVLSPRNWRDPGFDQGEEEAVVCVSLADAQAYGEWHSQQTGERYRLPSASDARTRAPEIIGRPLSLWLLDCGADCHERQVAGASWRSDETQRVLDTTRGYDDVGFRLVREP